MQTAVALLLALASTTLTNIAYLREHEAAAKLPVLSMRRPLHSAHALLTDRSWMLGFAMESGGFLLYAAALALASLALVQSVAAGGIGVLAFASARFARRRLTRRELSGVLLSVLGLVALGISLVGGTSKGGSGSTTEILVWLGLTTAVALVLLVVGRRVNQVAVAYGIAGGLFFSIGDISTKVATEGNARAAFVVGLIVGYTLGTALLQIGYQAGAALTVAGLATLLTNAVPIAAGTIVLREPVPGGVLGVLAFGAVTAGAVLLARPAKGSARSSRSGDAVPLPRG
jgi:drug/metabolite transporter (DMT)-like permease